MYKRTFKGKGMAAGVVRKNGFLGWYIVAPVIHSAMLDLKDGLM